MQKSMTQILLAMAVCVTLLPLSLTAQNLDKKTQKAQEKAMAGPRATVLRITILYVAPDKDSEKIARIQPGREMVVAETSGPWVRVYANTDIEKEREADQPMMEEPPIPPLSGWMEAKGIVKDSTPDGDQILMGEAANEEALAADPKGPANAATSARLLYRRLVEIFPASPFVPEASWRAADIRWQIQKADAQTRSSAREKEAYLREELQDDEMKKIIKLYPHTKQFDLAAFALIDNKTCGDWQGDLKCPEKESELYEKYAAEHPDGPVTAKALYYAVYRQAALADMLHSDGNEKRSAEAKHHAQDLATKLKDKFPLSDYAVRAGALVFKLTQGVPVYGIDID